MKKRGVWILCALLAAASLTAACGKTGEAESASSAAESAQTSEAADASEAGSEEEGEEGGMQLLGGWTIDTATEPHVSEEEKAQFDSLRRWTSGYM